MSATRDLCENLFWRGALGEMAGGPLVGFIIGVVIAMFARSAGWNANRTSKPVRVVTSIIKLPLKFFWFFIVFKIAFKMALRKKYKGFTLQIVPA